MQADLENLRITKQEVEAFVDSDSKTALALEFHRGFILKDSKQMLSVILTEVFLFIILLSFIMPVSLIVLRNAGTLPNNPASVIRLFSLIFGICSLGMLLWNIYLWQQAKQVKSLAKLMDKVDKYNHVIQAIALIDQLEAVDSSPSRFSNPNSRQEVLEVMSITKETLSSALKMEKLIRKYHNSLGTSHE
ncbi:MAG: hypothetical protein LDL41_23070, partial [Coleofasciculus sp. S288]|nr:hypothetical protein [Coleofasciculus sp. S288]